MSYRDSADFARETGETKRLLQGMVRRLAVTLTNGARWQFLGRKSQGTIETIAAEVFGVLGFYARPPKSGRPEGIAVAVGGTQSTVVVATRDEATRQAAVGSLAEGETAVYNDKAVIVIKADGKVEIRLVGGVAVPLATLADLDALKDIFDDWIPVASDGGAALKAALVDPATGWHPVGTSILKGQ